MTSHKVATPGSDAAAVQPTTSVVDTNPEGIASSDTEPDTKLTATQDESASVDARPSVSVGTLRPLVAGLAGLAASSGAPIATPTLGTAGAPPTTTMSEQPARDVKVASAVYRASAERKRHEHMGGHLIAAEQIGHLRAELSQAAIAASAMTDQFASAVAAKDANILDLERRLNTTVANADAALAARCTAEERRELVELHFRLSRDLDRSRNELGALQATHDRALADSQTATATLQTALDASERDLSRSQTENAPLRAENARLTEVVAQLTRENIDFGKRPVAAPAAPILTHADVLAIVTAHAAASPRNETGGEPMDTEGDPRGSTSDALYHGIESGRTVGQKHALPQAVRQDDPTPTEPISARKLALMRARKAHAAPSYAKAAKTEGLLFYHSADHPIAPFTDAKLAAHLTEYADELLLSRDDEDLRGAQQVIDDLRDHLTRLYTANKMRRKANWMLEMPPSIEDIYTRDAALKGPKLLAHYPAAPANDEKLDEKLPRASDRQGLKTTDDGGEMNSRLAKSPKVEANGSRNPATGRGATRVRIADEAVSSVPMFGTAGRVIFPKANWSFRPGTRAPLYAARNEICPKTYNVITWMAEPRSSGHATARFWKHDMQMGDTLVYNPDTVMLNHVHKQLVFCVLGKDAVQGNCLEESKHLVFQKLQAGATITPINA
eukprot:gene26840-biopygen4140